MENKQEVRGTAIPRRLSYAVSTEKLDILRRLRLIDDAHCHNGNVGRALAKFNSMMDDVEATCQMAGEGDELAYDSSPRSNLEEAHALVITAPSFAGKSHILQQIAKDKRLLPFVDEYGPRRVFLRIDAPFPCTLKTLALEILSALKVPYSKTSNLHLLWHMVRMQFIAQGILILQINEFHNTLIGRNTNELELVATAMKAILVGTIIVDFPEGDQRADITTYDQGERYPVFLLLAGTPGVRDFTKDRSTENHEQFSRRCREVEFREIPMVRDKNSGELIYRGMSKLIENIQVEMGFKPDDRLVSPDMQKRFYKASGHHFGRMLHILKLAAKGAVKSEKMGIFDCLPDTFETLYNTETDNNCFLIPDIDSCAEPPTVNHSCAEATERTKRRRKR